MGMIPNDVKAIGRIRRALRDLTPEEQQQVLMFVAAGLSADEARRHEQVTQGKQATRGGNGSEAGMPQSGDRLALGGASDVGASR